MSQEFCKRAYKPCRSKVEALERANSSNEYRRVYKCEFCDWWHLTSKLKRDNELNTEPLDEDY